MPKSTHHATMEDVEWLDALDFDLALSNVQSDIFGDWYRDPWGWAELEWLVPEHLEEHAVPRLNASGVKAAAALDVPKENFAVRPAVVLDPLDRLLYQALVDCLSVRLIGSLPAWVYGWRLIREKKPQRGRYAPNDGEWDAFRDHLKRLATYDFVALTTDIVSFFASVPEVPLGEQIIAAGSNEPAERLVDMLSAWYRTTGRGLPQRCAASAVLAHMYLRPLDDVLARYSKIPKGALGQIPEGRALRWMDDIWLFGRTSNPLREAQIAMQAGMRDLGLEMNIGKTRVLRGDDMAEAVFELEHSAVDSGLQEDDPDVAPLDELIDRVVEDPELAERTTIRFMSTRMREHEIYDRIEDIADATPQMPQGADHLARLFRASGHWRDLQDWYVTYARRWEARLPWTVGQLGTMFPSTATVEEGIRSLFAETVARANTQLPLVGVAAQRLAAWSPDDARVIIRDAAAKESHPLVRRTLGLAALHAGEVKNVVRKILQQHEENAVVLAMLEDTNFARSAIPVSPDFSG